MLFSLFVKEPTLYKISYKNTNLFSLATQQLFAANAGPRPLARSCQNRQASTDALAARWAQGRTQVFVRTDKQAPRAASPSTPWDGSSHASSEQTSKHALAQGRQVFCQNRQASTHRYVLRTSSCPGTAALLPEQTSKQLSTGYPQFLGKLSTAFAHDSSSTAQEPWSPVHIGSVFSPWTTNDSTWDA